ncbi:MAG: TolC family protein [Bacteroidota bacterium]
MKIKTAYLFMFLFLVVITKNTFSQNDTTLTLDSYLKQVIDFHPLAKQAKTLNALGKAELRMAKGALDPTLTSNYNEKNFVTTHYYSMWDNALKIPTWYGIDFKAGFENNNGTYLSSENYTPTNGLSYAGISVPLGQGLIIDERRNAIKQAKIAQNLAEAEKVKLINKLLLQATKDFWEWSFAYQKKQYVNQGLELATLRFNAVTERVKQGDLPAIDSVEAKIAMQDRIVLLTQADVELNNARLSISNYLWLENNTPAELNDKITPQPLPETNNTISADSLLSLLNYAKENHPDLQKWQYKLNQLKIEQKFAADKLKPKLNVNYNLLQGDFYINPSNINTSYLQNNYKLGVYFNYPLFLRQERGKLELVKIKKSQTNFELQFANREIENNIKATYNQMLALNKMLTLQAEIVENNFTLRNGEQRKFDNGESSFFLINTREINLIYSQIKAAELKSKYQKNKVELLWSAGKI